MLKKFTGKIRNYFIKRMSKKVFQDKIIRCKTPIKLIIGSCTTGYMGWLSSDRNVLDLINDNDFQCFNGKQVINILAEHVWEHLSLEEGMAGFRNCYSILMKGGKLRIAVPDVFSKNFSKEDDTKYGHKTRYNYQLLSNELLNVGFEVRLLEWCDENGIFHFNEWMPEDGGMITRSLRFDSRNTKGKIKCTSIIIDAIK